MKPFTRLFKYIIPYSFSIIIAIICSGLIAFCDTAYLSILAETIDIIKVIETKGLPTSVKIFDNFILGFNRLSTIIGNETTQAERGWIIHLADTGDAIRLVSFVVLAILGIFVIKGILSFGDTYIMSRIGQKLIFHLRQDLYSRLICFPLSFFTKSRTGDIMSRGTNDMAALQNSFNSIANVSQAIVKIIVYVTVMVINNWQLTLLTILIFPPAIYVINRFGQRIKVASKRIQMKVADISSYLERTVFGIKVIKSFATEDWEKEQFFRENRGKYVVAMKRARLTAYLVPIIEIISALGMVTVFWFGFWQVIIGNLTIGRFIGFIGLVGMIYTPVKTLGAFNASFQQAMASAERIFEIMDIQPEIYESPNSIFMKGIKGDVEFRNISFGYDREKLVLSNINLKVASGESIALVGPSGAGKTTFISLITRFYDPTNGEIFIDDYPISKVSLKSLRQQIGLVPQESVLFGGTIRENIAYGRFDASEDEIIHAAKSANAHEFIEKFPGKYNTSIGEHGMQLSGGQRQRLAIARVILKNPKILILDEATSSLDTESEVFIQEALRKLMEGRTTFIIAHRLSTVINADRILVLKDGQIVECGTHNQLFNQNGLYRKLCDAQFRRT